MEQDDKPKEKKDKTTLITAIIGGIVALSTGILANYDKIAGKTINDSSTEIKKENVIDSVSFEYKLDKVIKDCPNAFSSTIENVREEDEEDKNYNSKIKFKEGLTSVTFSKDSNPIFNVLIYTGDDATIAYQKKLEIYKKVSEHLKVKATQEEEKEDNYATVVNTFEKGSVLVQIIDTATSDGETTSEEIYLTVSLK